MSSAHDHSHHHSHSHDSHGACGHSAHHHGVTERVGLAFFLNLSFALIELVGGLWTNSLAILSDALHDFGDSLALGAAWWLERKSHQKSDLRFTYGYRRFSVLSALLTGVILLSGGLWILSQSIPRLWNPEPVKAEGMLGLALLGLTVNGLAAWRLSKGHSLNEKMLRWHFIEDLAGWSLVLLGAGVMMVVDWPWLDPLMAVILSLWVMKNVFRHLHSTLSVFLQASPDHLKNGEAEKWVCSLPGVLDVHHAHVWSLDGETHILTCHVVHDPVLTGEALAVLKVQIKQGLHEKFGIQEATLEFECRGEACRDPHHH